MWPITDTQVSNMVQMCFGTFHFFEANSHFEHMLPLGTCSAFVTFFRFESMILADFLFIFFF